MSNGLQIALQMSDAGPDARESHLRGSLGPVSGQPAPTPEPVPAKLVERYD
jgi:hypothetical protein